MKAKEERFFTIRDVQRILVCIAAGTVMAVNLRTFVHTGGLLPGGIAGLTVLVAGLTVLVQGIFQRFFGMDVPYGRLYLALNAFPILLAVRKIGKKFTAYSCITIGVVTILTEILPTTTITYDTLLISIFGGIINGAAISMALLAGATGTRWTGSIMSWALMR